MTNDEIIKSLKKSIDRHVKDVLGFTVVQSVVEGEIVVDPLPYPDDLSSESMTGVLQYRIIAIR